MSHADRANQSRSGIFSDVGRDAAAPIYLVWFDADRVGGTWGRCTWNLRREAPQQLARAALVELEQEMFKSSVAVGDHKMNKLGIR